LGVGKRTSERKNGKDDAEFSSSSAVNKLKPANNKINRYKAKPKTKQFQKQIQKRNLNGERGGHLADANGSIRNAEFGSQDPSFGNKRTAVGNRIPSTRSTVTRPAQVKPTKEKDQFFFGQDPVNNLST
jgi:hypothetical protein